MVTKTEVKADEPVFDDVVTTLARRLQEFSPEEWEAIRDSGIEPAFESERSEDELIREEFLAGAELMGLVGGRKTPKAQQLRLAEVLGSSAERIAISWPRRSSKTTTILCVLLGRCLLRPGYTVLASAQDQTKTGARFRDWRIQIERALGDTDPDTWPLLFRSSNGSQHMRFRNGSMFYMLRPIAESYRGEAADAVWLDEAQSHDATLSADLLAGVLPTMDTADDDTQLIVSGTAGELRSGLLWDFLTLGRDPENPTGISEYAAPDGTTPEELADPELWKRIHPGVGTLTTVERVQANFDAMSLPVFAREYAGLWPEDYAASVIPGPVWESAALPKKMPLPKDVAFGFDISPNGSTAAIVAAWRIDGVAYVELVAHEPSSAWVRKRVADLAKKYAAPVGFNDIGSIRVVYEELTRGRLVSRTRLLPQTYKDVPQASVVFLRDLEDGKLHHFDQPGLSDAAMLVGRRKMNGDRAWAFGPGMAGGDITPVLAATMALRAFDQKVAQPRLKAIVA